MPGTVLCAEGNSQQKPWLLPSESFPCSGGEIFFKRGFVCRAGEMVVLSLKEKRPGLGGVSWVQSRPYRVQGAP